MKPDLYIVPIEPLEERYTGEWYKFLPGVFSENFNVTTIDGTPTTTVVETGAFLDMNSTIHYKAGQMQKISELFRHKKIKPGSVFFISDVEFWGIESLRLLSQINQVPIKIYGFLHAASYTIEDAFAVAAPYQKYTELGWIAALDGVFVGSFYHKDAVIERRIKPYAHQSDWDSLSNKLIVTGNPLFKSAYNTSDLDLFPKKDKIVITNRFDYEKRPEQSLLTAYLIKQQLPHVEVVITTSRPTFRSNQQWLVDLARGYEKDGWVTIKENLTKEQYHNELKSAKVMLTNSIEENFGYCIAEAMIFGTAPIMPNNLSHPEFVIGDKTYLFETVDEAVNKAIYIMKMHNGIDFSYCLRRFYEVPKIMSDIMASKITSNQLGIAQGE